VAVFIHPVLYSIFDEAHVRIAKPLERRLGHSMPFWYAISLLFVILQMLTCELRLLRGRFVMPPRSS
jgi:hypothetical protein